MLISFLSLPFASYFVTSTSDDLNSPPIGLHNDIQVPFQSKLRSKLSRDSSPLPHSYILLSFPVVVTECFSPFSQKRDGLGVVCDEGIVVKMENTTQVKANQSLSLFHSSDSYLAFEIQTCLIHKTFLRTPRQTPLARTSIPTMRETKFSVIPKDSGISISAGSFQYVF